MSWVRGVCFSLIATVSGFGSTGNLKALFEKHYRTHYAYGRCADNVLGFVRDIERICPAPTERFFLVSIRNRGLSVFGMVNAETARGRNKHGPVDRETNWYHHVFLMDDNGWVYDFDFTSRPRIVRIEQYIESMFLDEPECEEPRPGEFCGGRDRKLEDYQLQSVKAESVVEEDEPPAKSATLGEVLDDYRILIH